VIALGVADLVVIAARTLDVDPVDLLDQVDLDAVEEALAPARAPENREFPQVAGAALLVGLLGRRPFPRANDRIALVALLQLLALNDFDVDLDPPEATTTVLAEAGAGLLGRSDVAAWLAARLRRRCESPPRRRIPLSRSKGEPMFERFSDRARRAVVLAQEAARGLQHGYIGTEHVLLGLIQDDESVAGAALAERGVSAASVEAEIEKIVGLGKESPAGHIPFTPRAKKTLEMSLREALRLGDAYIGSHHILLGIIREGEGLAMQILVTLDAGPDPLRESVMRLLGERDRFPSDFGPAASRVGPGGPGSDPVAAAAQENRRLSELIVRLVDEAERLRDLLRRHGIDPGDSGEGTSRTA
jgi:prophage maintenance system killer protein